MQPHRCSAVCMLIKIRAHSSAGFFFFFFSSTPFFPSEIVTARRSLQLAVRCVPPPPTTKCHRSVCRSVGWMCHRIWLVAARRLEKESSGAYRGGVHGISVCQRGENQSVGMLLKLHVFQMDFCMEITEWMGLTCLYLQHICSNPSCAETEVDICILSIWIYSDKYIKCVIFEHQAFWILVLWACCGGFCGSCSCRCSCCFTSASLFRACPQLV